jgi:hypothetical protein
MSGEATTRQTLASLERMELAEDTMSRLRRAARAEDVVQYGRMYTPTFAEGSIELDITSGAVSGSELADELIGIAARKTNGQTFTTGPQGLVLGTRAAEIRGRTDLEATWVRSTLRSAKSAATEEEVDALLIVLMTPNAAMSATATVQVEDVYNLVVFAGLGFVGGDAASGAWDVSDVSGVPELVSDGASYVDPELLLGATLYPGRKPRTYSGFDAGLSMALGVADFQDGKLTPFRSFYFGPTVGWSRFSVTFAGVVKVGDHLRDGYAVGDTLPVGTDIDSITESRPGLGWGVAVNVPFQLMELFGSKSSKSNTQNEGGN